MIVRILLALSIALAVPACGDDDDNSGQDAGTQLDGDIQADGAVAVENWLGAACTCTGAECEQAGVPKPSTGTIEGCDTVDASWTGADLVCMRSYTGALATDTYFANGFCGLMATTCVGDDLICGSAVMGDFPNLVACPGGSVMIEGTQEVDVFGMTATIESKSCAPVCGSDDDCRVGETDPVFADEVTQYQCVDKDGVKFCYDPRNLSANYTATAY
jgi:hypothetical protein